MRLVFTICVFYVLQIDSVAQDKFDLNGQLSALRKSKPDTNRILILHEIGKYYLFKSGRYASDIDSAIYCFAEAVRLSNSLPLDTVTIRSFRNENLCRLGEAYFQQGDTLTANKCFRDVIADYRKVGDTKREARTWLRLGNKTMPDSNPAVIQHFLNALKLYQETKDKTKEAEVLMAIGQTHKEQNKLDLAKEELFAALHIYDSLDLDDDNHIKAVYHLGELKRYLGDFEGALIHALTAIRMREALGSNSRLGYAGFYQAVASLYSELGQSEKSVLWYRKAVEDMDNIIRNDLATFTAYLHACSLAEELIKLNRATEALSEILNLMKHRPAKTDLEKGCAARALGLCYSALRNDALAEQKYNDMVRYYEKGDFFSVANVQSEIMAEIYFSISKYYIDRKQYNAAKVYLQKIANTPRGIFTLSRHRDLQIMLFKADSSAGNYLGAMEHFRAQQALNDSIFNIAKSRQIASLQIQFETEKKEHDLALLLNKNQLQQNRLNLMIAGVVLLILTLGFVFSRYWTKQKSNKQLMEQQSEINRKNVSLGNLVREKEWLLKEIHHRVKNNLQMVMSLLDTQSDYIENDTALSALDKSKHRMQAISLIHQKLYKTENVSDINMSVYTAELIDYLRESYQTDCHIDFRLNIQPMMLNVAFAVPIGLILNEAITNSIKHAFVGKTCGCIIISLTNDDENVLLTIMDNGIGLPGDFDNVTHHSFGMDLIVTLCEQIEADLHIASDDGTHIQIAFASTKMLTSTR